MSSKKAKQSEEGKTWMSEEEVCSQSGERVAHCGGMGEVKLPEMISSLDRNASKRKGKSEHDRERGRV